MYIQGSMMAALQQRMSNAHEIALLVIDESEANVPGEKSNTRLQDMAHPNVTACQQRLLMYMQRMGCKVWSIRFLQHVPAANTGPDNTRTHLRALYDGKEQLLRKPEPNAFNQTTLDQDLKHAGIKTLVIMGFHANACVHETVGNRWWTKGMDDGATHLGYKVMTCDQVLHGGPANWSHATPAHYANLEFYSLF